MMIRRPHTVFIILLVFTSLWYLPAQDPLSLGNLLIAQNPSRGQDPLSLRRSLSTQDPLNTQDQPLTLHYDRVPVRTVLDAIESSTGLTFSYGSRLFDDSEIVTVHLEEVSLATALETLFRDKSIRFVLVEKQIVLKKQRRREISGSGDPAPELLVRRYTVSGHVRDVSSGEVLIGATIAVAGEALGTISNDYGFYSLTLEGSHDSLVCTYVGFRNQVRVLSGADQSLDFELVEKRQELTEVVVFGDEIMESLQTARSSDQKVRPSSVKKMPALFGEKDVIKSLAAIPGIKFFGDGSTIFYVRGGSRDQNLVTIDDAPVYNPTHMLGLFSTIVPDAVRDIQVYKGDFPAKYGGRLSSLVDIRTKDGNMQRFGMDGSFGLLSSRLSIEGPIWKDHISYFLSGRRSYFLRTLQQANSDLQDLHFADLHFKINYRINDRNRVYFSVYNSEDNFEVASGAGNINGINWQNAAATLRWNHLFSDQLFSNTTLYASRYDYFLNTNIVNGDYWNAHIDNFSLKSDFTWYISPTNTFRFGGRIAQHFMNPGNFYRNHQVLPLPFVISTRSANESNIYFSNQLLLAPDVSLRVGLRLTAWNNIGPAVEYSFDGNRPDSAHYAAGQIYHTYVTGDPRLALVYELDHRDLLQFSYSRTSQFEHLITNSISPFSTLEVWLPSGPQIKPQRADQLTIGYTRELREGGLKLETEVYYKYMRNQIDYRDHAQLLMNPFIERELRFGNGNAYGMEVMLSRKSGRLNGWISYTLSRSFLTIEGINSGDPYPSYGDRPHDLSVFFSYRLRPRLELSANFIYMTGSPFTAPTAFYYYDNIQVPIYFKRNNDRLPDYHRLDVALNWDLRKKEGRFDHELIFSVYNLYGRKNPVAIHFNKIENASGQLVTPYDFYSAPELIPTQFYLYSFVPSVSYHFSF
jgi:hypothetical protein